MVVACNRYIAGLTLLKTLTRKLRALVVISVRLVICWSNKNQVGV